MDNRVCSRREFILEAGKCAAALVVLAPVFGTNCADAEKKPRVDGGPITLDLTREEYGALSAVGGALKIPNTIEKGKPILVIRVSETEAVALSSKCTHLGCELNLPADGQIVCPCHGASFSLAGKTVKGPAKKDLSAYATKLEGSKLTIQKPPSARAKSKG